MINRLLSDDEIKQALQSYYEYALPTITAENREIAAAQLAKADAEWIQWSNERCPHKSDFRIKRECDTCWQERKKEIGQ